MPEKGYDEMTDLKMLNDCELAQSLHNNFVNKQCYCTCGVTLVAVNLQEARKVTVNYTHEQTESHVVLVHRIT